MTRIVVLIPQGAAGRVTRREGSGITAAVRTEVPLLLLVVFSLCSLIFPESF